MRFAIKSREWYRKEQKGLVSSVDRKFIAKRELAASFVKMVVIFLIDKNEYTSLN
ncbi:MAG: hypothetical protein FD143_3094 [Ignavibacteria bacterium]|nr:MAG: hypothetical protein FD143_3094 [Ignavibacteria bacterium]